MPADVVEKLSSMSEIKISSFLYPNWNDAEGITSKPTRNLSLARYVHPSTPPKPGVSAMLGLFALMDEWRLQWRSKPVTKYNLSESGLLFSLPPAKPRSTDSLKGLF